MRLKKGNEKSNENKRSTNRPTKNQTRPSTNLLSRTAFLSLQPLGFVMEEGPEGNKGYERGGLER